MCKADTSLIKQLLKKSGVKQKDIASLLGVSTQFVNQVINGRRSTITVMKAIAIAINKPISDLWSDDEQ